MAIGSPPPQEMKCAVIGGSGALGRALVGKLVQGGHEVTNVDLCINEECPVNVQLSSPLTDASHLHSAAKETRSHGPFDAIFCVAGGWQGGNATHSDFLSSVLSMWEMNGISAALAAALADCLVEGRGMMVMTSAKASLGATPGMLGYGMAKAATNHLIQSLAAAGSGLPTGCTVFGILPETLDTLNNRKWMPKADFSAWTPTDLLASQLVQWMENPADRPKSGSLIIVETRNNHTRFTSS